LEKVDKNFFVKQVAELNDVVIAKKLVAINRKAWGNDLINDLCPEDHEPYYRLIGWLKDNYRGKFRRWATNILAKEISKLLALRPKNCYTLAHALSTVCNPKHSDIISNLFLDPNINRPNDRSDKGEFFAFLAEHGRHSDIKNMQNYISMSKEGGYPTSVDTLEQKQYSELDIHAATHVINVISARAKA